MSAAMPSLLTGTDLAGPLLAGLVAGWGVAIPLGAIGVLVVDAGMRAGFRPAAAAAAGVAAADFLYAAVAAAAGAVVAEGLAPYERTVQLVAAAVLVGVAAAGLWQLRHRSADAALQPPPSGRGMFLRFLALTSVNPATVAYFAALIAGLPAVASAPAEAKLAFVLAAGAASLSWQLVLAGAGATLHHRLPPSARLWTALLGNALVLGLALRMVLAA
jgi:threonine/homoserine/homoserine lactone efflux protein